MIRDATSLVEAVSHDCHYWLCLWLTSSALISPGNRAILSVAAGHFTVDYTAALPTMMYPFLVVSLDLSYANVGVAAAAYTLANALVQPLCGYIGDRFGHRQVAVVGLVMQSLFIGSLIFAWNYLSLVLLLIFAGIFTGMFHPVGAAVANRAARTLKGASVGTFFIGGMLGFAVSPLIAAKLFEEFGLIYAAFMIIPASAAGFAVFRFASAIPQPTAEKDAGAKAAPSLGMDGRTVAPLIWAMFFRSYTFGGISVFIPLYFRSLEFSIHAGGLALTLFMSGFAVGTITGGALADRLGIKPVIVVTLALATPLILIFIHAPGSLVALIAITLAGFLLAGSFTPTIVMIQNQLPRLVGAATGVVLGFTFASGAVGQWTTGRLADSFGFEIALSVVALASLTAALGGLLMTGSVRPRWITPQTA